MLCDTILRKGGIVAVPACCEPLRVYLLVLDANFANGTQYNECR